MTRQSDPRQVRDAWAEPVAAPSGTLALDDPRRLRAESADISRAFDTTDPEWLGREVLSLGAVSLSGRLRAYDPVGVPSRAVDLPVIVEAGSYPAFVLLSDEADLLVVRFGGGRPRSWQEVVRPDGSDEYVPIEAATYAVSSHETWQVLTDDPAVRDAFEAAFHAARSTCVLSLPGAPDLGLVVNSSVGGDLPAWCYLGSETDGAVSAIAVALVTDAVYRYRPASDDSDVIASVERLVAGLTADDEEADQLRESWADVKEELSSSGGVVSANLRSRVHELHESFERA